MTDVSNKGYIKRDVEERISMDKDLSLTPPLPRKIGIEINNSCNHKCHFCPNPIMTRQRAVMDGDLVIRVTQEAYDAGIREISFYSGGEPFLNKNLADYVHYAKKIGFEYCYLSTNGGKVVSDKIERVLSAGLDSLKFSVNAGTREAYKQIHGIDEFDYVLENIEKVSDYKRNKNPSLKLFVSFVETALSKDTFDSLVRSVAHLVDDVVAYPFVVMGTPLSGRGPSMQNRPEIGYEDTIRTEEWNRKRLRLPCYQLWNYLNVTLEGYISACCSDYNNDLVVGNLHHSSLLDAWHSEEFQELRRQHMARDVKGTLCEGCIAQKHRSYEAINLHLRDRDN